MTTSDRLAAEETAQLVQSGYDPGRPPVDLDPDGKYVKPTKEQLREYVGRHPKFLVKDNWAVYGSVWREARAPNLGLGDADATSCTSYNNVRYMFEATLNLAQITGRIPVIPDTQWARNCAVDR